MIQSFVDSQTSATATGDPASGNAPATSNCVLVIGASSSIGRAVAREWALAGSDIILAGRDLDDLNRTAADLRIRSGRRVEVVSFDAEAFETHEAFWRDCQIRAGGALHGVVMLHGLLPVQSEAQADLKITRKTIDVNFISAVSVLTFAANDFEVRKNGFLCVVTSVAGDRGRQSNYVYGSAKAALTTFLQGLRNRLSHSGVNVLTVKPGFVDTAMTWGFPGLFLVATPERVAADIHRAIRRGASEIYTPWFWRYIMLIIKSIPEFIFKRMKM